MTIQSDAEGIRKYLLGNLSEEEQLAIEEQLFTDEATLEQHEIVEEDLIDDYLNEELSKDDRIKFEQRFLSTPERKEQVLFARSLRQYIKDSEPDPVRVPPQPLSFMDRFRVYWAQHAKPLSAATAIAVFALVAIGIWFLRDTQPRTFATIQLSVSDRTRGSGDQQLAKVPYPLVEDALKATLQLPSGSLPASSFSAILQAPNTTTHGLTILESNGSSVTVLVKPSQLSRGLNVIDLYGVPLQGGAERSYGSYSFMAE